jgi:hypothetical protein
MCMPFFSKLILVVVELCRTRSYQTDCKLKHFIHFVPPSPNILTIPNTFLLAYKWIWIYIGIHIPVFTFNLYVFLISYMFFIPIFGRVGPVNADLIMSLVTSLYLIFIFGFLVRYTIFKNSNSTI